MPLGNFLLKSKNAQENRQEIVEPYHQTRGGLQGYDSVRTMSCSASCYQVSLLNIRLVIATTRCFQRKPCLPT